MPVPTVICFPPRVYVVPVMVGLPLESTLNWLVPASFRSIRLPVKPVTALTPIPVPAVLQVVLAVVPVA